MRTLADRTMLKPHVMRQDVHDSSLLRRHAAGKDQDLALGITPEQCQLRVKAQGLRVV